jgi:hypothetical protein
VKLTTHLHVMPHRLRMRGALPSFSLYVFYVMLRYRNNFYYTKSKVLVSILEHASFVADSSADNAW